VLKKVLGWAVVAFLAFYLVTQPVAAGHTAHSILDGLKTAATSLGTFFKSV
jgi:hypothetical protein